MLHKVLSSRDVGTCEKGKMQAVGTRQQHLDLEVKHLVLRLSILHNLRCHTITLLKHSTLLPRHSCPRPPQTALRMS